MDPEKISPSQIEEAAGLLAQVCSKVSQVVVGQEEVLRFLLAALLAGGHGLLIGVPGLAKTLLVRSLARALGWQFRRIQFTPDLMPSDILGSEILQVDPQSSEKYFKFQPGPVFTNLLLADEINRTPPKTQAALLEAMQEKQVTVGGKTYPLPDPFLVLATQNPIEQEGTYPLPEAQLDRFLLSLVLSYPAQADEEKIAGRLYRPEQIEPLDQDRTKALVGLAEALPTPPSVLSYAVSLVRATRPQEKDTPQEVRSYVEWGAGPRAAQHLLLLAKGIAVLSGRFAPTAEDVSDAFVPALRHRIILNFRAISEGINRDALLEEVRRRIPAP